MSRSMLVIADEHEYDNICLEKAHDIAAPLNAKLEVVRFLSHFDSQGELVCQQIIEQAKQTLDHDIFDIFGDDARVTCNVILTDEIADWVVGACKQKQFDLVVKTGQRTENLFHIPTDWQLMRQLSCPILIVNNQKWKSKPAVMAAVDLSTPGARNKELNTSVLQWTTLWSDVFNCSAHVIYSIPIARALLELDIVDKTEYRRKKQPEAEKQLSKLLEHFELDHAHTHITAGPPQKAIHHMANELKADLVIMGCVGRKGLQGFVIGNTAENVLHHLPTDTLIVGAGGLKTRKRSWIPT